MDMLDKDYFEAKSRQCFRLAADCPDPDVAFRLRQLGLEFAGQAIELGADPKGILPDGWSGITQPPR
jgi:hypothetical protein